MMSKNKAASLDETAFLLFGEMSRKNDPPTLQTWRIAFSAFNNR